MKLDSDFYISINYHVQEYRKRFLKRKNINRYKNQPKNTPIIIDRLINSFDRKIKGVPIFTNEIKEQYLKGLQDIFNVYYDESFEPKISRKESYYKYLSETYCLYGKKKYKSKALPLKEYLSSGLSQYYR